MFSYDAGPSLDIHVYSQVGKTSHHTHFTVVANILASNFIDDLATPSSWPARPRSNLLPPSLLTI